MIIPLFLKLYTTITMMKSASVHPAPLFDHWMNRSRYSFGDMPTNFLKIWVK